MCEGFDSYIPGNEEDRSMFAEPGARSALRRPTKRNPSFPCPTCGAANVLTAKDKALGYQCNVCADGEEGYF